MIPFWLFSVASFSSFSVFYGGVMSTKREEAGLDVVVDAMHGTALDLGILIPNDFSSCANCCGRDATLYAAHPLVVGVTPKNWGNTVCHQTMYRAVAVVRATPYCCCCWCSYSHLPHPPQRKNHHRQRMWKLKRWMSLNLVLLCRFLEPHQRVGVLLCSAPAPTQSPDRFLQQLHDAS